MKITDYILCTILILVVIFLWLWPDEKEIKEHKEKEALKSQVKALHGTKGHKCPKCYNYGIEMSNEGLKEFIK